MQIKILYFGKVKNKNLLFLINELKKRINRLELVELKDVKDSNIDVVKQKEFEVFSNFINSSNYNILLIEDGLSFSSYDFYSKLKKISKPIVFFITGPFGPNDNLKGKMDLCLSLSKMTFTHEQALYLLIEQIYRVQCFSKNIPYNK